MKRITGILGAAALALIFGTPAMAQQINPSDPNMGFAVPKLPGAPSSYAPPGMSGLPNQGAFNEWASKHSKAAEELQANPGLMYDPAWRSRHPHFQTFIQNHPKDWSQLKRNGSQYYNQDFNNYLGKHPKVAGQLREDPSLLYDPAYRKAHPELGEYMQNHPSVWHSMKYQHRHAEEAAETPAQEAAEEHHGKHWEHHEKMEHHWQEKAQKRHEHEEKWEQKHGSHDKD
jgi:hypothetical protein